MYNKYISFGQEYAYGYVQGYAYGYAYVYAYGYAQYFLKMKCNVLIKLKLNVDRKDQNCRLTNFINQSSTRHISLIL